MKKNRSFFLLSSLALFGLTICCLALWSRTSLLMNSVERLAEDVRVSLIDLDGHVIYDSAKGNLPNHASRAEIEALKKDGRPLTLVRESQTLHMAMFYHARKVGDYILRIAIPYESVSTAKRYAQYCLLAAIGIGALVIVAIFIFARRYEQRLSRLAAERDIQNRLLTEMSALEQFRRDFISNVTHEIKSPVTGILGAAEVLCNSLNLLDESERRELCSIIMNQSRRLSALVDDILSLAEIEMAKSKNETDFLKANIVDIVQTSINLCRPQAEKSDIAINFSPAGDASEAEIFFDPKLMESAVTNLILNAIRHSGSKKIDVRIKKAADNKTSIEIEDYGIGIPPECQPRIFERFYRVDKGRSRSSGGTGLGLAIVKHIVQLHNGEITVTSSPGNGALFTITI